MNKRRLVLVIGGLKDREYKFLKTEIDSAVCNAVDAILTDREEVEKKWWERFIKYTRTGK